MAILENLRIKYRNISNHIRYQGFWKFFVSKIYDRYLGFRFKKIGIYHPKRSGDLSVTISQSINKDAHENQPSSFYDIKKALKKTGLKYSEISMLDVGCGEGRVLNLGMLLNFKKVMGIDLDEPALLKAAENCSKMQEHGFNTSFNVEHADAALFAIPADINLVYMYNPFGEKTMERFLANTINYRTNKDHELYFIYCVPDFVDVFNKYSSVTKLYEYYNKNKTSTRISILKFDLEKNNVSKHEKVTEQSKSSFNSSALISLTSLNLPNII